MIKRLYLANGALQTPLSKSAENISVDAGTAAYMASILNTGDWAYLGIIWNGCVEVVKVYKTYSGLQVDRAQDGTKAGAFPVGAVIRYQLTQAEIQDATVAAPINLYASGYGVATVNVISGAWVIGYPDITPTVVGGISTYYTYSDATLHIADYFPAAGCCTKAGNGAPLIGGPYFYFTSQPYSVESSDWMAPNPNRGTGRGSSFGFGDMWLLTQPNVVDPNMLNNVAYISNAELYGGQKVLSATDQYMQTFGIVVGNANLFGGQKVFSVNDTSYMGNNMYILQAQLYGSQVNYSNGVEKYIYPVAVLTSAALV